MCMVLRFQFSRWRLEKPNFIDQFRKKIMPRVIPSRSSWIYQSHLLFWKIEEEWDGETGLEKLVKLDLGGLFRSLKSME